MALRSLPIPDLGPKIEPIAPVELASTCDPTVKPGTVAFRDFVISHLGGRDVGITRECADKPNEHSEGRAWDWGVSASSPVDVDRVTDLFDWLFATDRYGNDMAMWRRIGLMYVIWNRQIWSSRFMEWRPYTGSSPHTDHVHFSFSWPGARGQTSLYSWLQSGGFELPEKLRPSGWTNVLIAIVAGVTGYMGVRWLRRRVT